MTGAGGPRRSACRRGSLMSAVDDLTELVESAGAAERAALASRWKERADVEALRRRVRNGIAEQHELERLAPESGLSDRRARLRAAFLDEDPVGTDPHEVAGSAVSHAD